VRGCVLSLCRDTDIGTSPRDDRTGSEHLLERREITGLRSGDDGVEKSLVLGGTDRPAMLTAQTAAGTGDELPGIRLAECEGSRDVPVRVVERLPEHVGGAFGRRQLLQEHAYRGLERFTVLSVERRVGRGVDHLDKRQADVHLAAGTSGLRDVDRESRRRRGEKCSGIAHGAPVSALPADPRLLHHVIRFTCTSEDPICDAEQPWTHGLKHRGVGLGHLAGTIDGHSRSGRGGQLQGAAPAHVATPGDSIATTGAAGALMDA
jgi:hypothetical protein